MAELGAGSGSDYPTGIDTDNTNESASTTVRFAVPNDLADAMVKVQNELGTEPKGTKTDVKTYLQTEHNTDGTHKTTLVTMLAGTQTIAGTKTFSSIDGATFNNLPSIPFSVSDNTASSITVTSTPTNVLSLSLGTATLNDVYLIYGNIFATKGATGGLNIISLNKTGVAVVDFVSGTSSTPNTYVEASSTTAWGMTVFAIAHITTAGTLTINLRATSNGSSSTGGVAYLRAVNISNR